jgi:hypothetical protein
MFDVFDKEYTSTGVQRRVALLFKLFNLKMAEGESLRDHIVTFDKLMSDLSSTGDPVNNKLAAIFLFNSLPPSFEYLKTTISVVNGAAKLEYLKVKDICISEVERKTISSSFAGESALLTSQTNRPHCTHCKGVGHIMDKC